MDQLLIILSLSFLLCFTLYQWWFQNSRNKQMSDRELAKIKWYNKASAWMVYSLLIFILVIGLISYNILVLMDAVMSLDL